MLSAVLSWPTSVTAVPGLVQIIARGGCRSDNSIWPARSASACGLDVAVRVANSYSNLSELDEYRGIDTSGSNFTILSPQFWSCKVHALAKEDVYQNTDPSPLLPG